MNLFKLGMIKGLFLIRNRLITEPMQYCGCGIGICTGFQTTFCMTSLIRFLLNVTSLFIVY